MAIYFFVPQDISGMIEAYGGKDKFEAKIRPDV
jgi:putative alpha-1,2-mannosidase